MKKRRILSIMLVLGVCLSGCSNDNISLTEEAQETALEVSWWGTDERTKYTIDALKEYDEKNPDIRVNKTYGEFSGFELKNDVKMFANTEADIMQIDYSWFAKYQNLGFDFYDLNQLSDVLDLSKYSDEVLSYGTNDKGQLIALPIALNVKVIWYNKSVYDKYGLPLPQTWDDLFEAAKVMKNDGVYPLDMDSKAVWMSCVAYVEQTTGHKVFDENNMFSFTKDEVKMMIEFYQRLVNDGVVERVSDRSEAKISDGIYAGTLQWVSGAAKYEQMITANGSEINAGMPPAMDNQKLMGWYVKPATMYAMSSHTEYPKEAGKLLSYIVQDKGMVLRQKLEKGVPCNKGALDILDKEGELAGTQYDATVMAEEKGYPLMSPYLENSKYESILIDAINKVLYNEAGIEEAAAEAYDGMAAIKN